MNRHTSGYTDIELKQWHLNPGEIEENMSLLHFEDQFLYLTETV